MVDKIKSAIDTGKIFPQSVSAACQGTEGAYSQFACENLFQQPEILYFESFNAVCAAVDKGMREYGILPLENSLHGSVTEVYDLMRKYGFYIVRSLKMKINHALLANHGVIPPQIKEIYSHEQALGQCGDFIKNLKDVKIISCANTAVAARTVAQSGRTDIAAIANPNCAELYNLSVISRDIQNNKNNYTRFICISKNLEIYHGADRISLMFTVPHKPGALYAFLAEYAQLGVNLTKLESRPIPGTDFDFMFYAEIEASVCSRKIIDLISYYNNASETFLFLGNYIEISAGH